MNNNHRDYLDDILQMAEYAKSISDGPVVSWNMMLRRCIRLANNIEYQYGDVYSSKLVVDIDHDSGDLMLLIVVTLKPDNDNSDVEYEIEAEEKIYEIFGDDINDLHLACPQGASLYISVENHYRRSKEAYFE